MLVAKVKFRNSIRPENLNVNGIKMRVGDLVVAQTKDGLKIGKVSLILNLEDSQKLDIILRVATREDLEREERNEKREKQLHDFCLARIKDRNIDMKLTRVEFLLNGSQANFYYTADTRVDFRELVKDLANEFHSRIQMVQIAPREETKLVGGIGPCGQQLCCNRYLNSFSPLAVSAARNQGLALNPTKLTGLCGKLKCCLSYEEKNYCNCSTGLPKVNDIIETADGECKVKYINILPRQITIEIHDGTLKTISACAIKKVVQAAVEDSPEKILGRETLRRIEDSYREYDETKDSQPKIKSFNPYKDQPEKPSHD
jgi:cell fate regulator YaaT (PSP1 superfamily)